MRWRLLATALVIGANLSCQGDGTPAAPGGGGGTGAGPGTGGGDPSGTGGGPAGTGGGPAGAGGGATGTGGGATGGRGTTEPATFQYNGALMFTPVVIGKPERVEISAPILPRTSVIYAPFPTSLAGEQTMAHDAALLFDWLLPQCAPLYPTITLAPADGSALTPAQLATNYDQVGLCAYQQYVAKPYWIPKLIDDVDICGTEMGAGWRLISETDLASLTEADFQTVSDTWNLHVVGGQGLGFFYSTLGIWVRAADGTIASGTLAPGVSGSRVVPLPPGISVSTDHYEGGLGLRCIRRTELP